MGCGIGLALDWIVILVEAQNARAEAAFADFGFVHVAEGVVSKYTNDT